MSSAQKAKFELKTLHDYGDAAILDEIRRVASLSAGKPLTVVAFGKVSRVGSTTVIRRFGSWLKALERAGLADSLTR